MHDTASLAGKLFFDVYGGEGATKVIDIGSQDINGTLREHAGSLEYTGIDIEPGKGVDTVYRPGEPFPFPDGSFDLAVSTSCFEHDPCFWSTFLEALRVLRPGGFFYVNAPSNGSYHGYPHDNWRFYPDAGNALVVWAERNGICARLVESGTLRRRGDIWNDFVAVFQKAPFHDKESSLLDRIDGVTNRRPNVLGTFQPDTEDMEIIRALNEQIRSKSKRIADLEEKLAESGRRVELTNSRLNKILTSYYWRFMAQVRRMLRQPDL